MYRDKGSDLYADDGADGQWNLSFLQIRNQNLLTQHTEKKERKNMQMIVALHPEMLCIAKVISFQSESSQDRKEAEPACTLQQAPQEENVEMQITDLSQSTSEV